jgi:hypothetical protein
LSDWYFIMNDCTSNYKSCTPMCGVVWVRNMVKFVIRFFNIVLVEKCISDINVVSILCICRKFCSSSLWFDSPLAFQSIIRSEFSIIGRFCL